MKQLIENWRLFLEQKEEILDEVSFTAFNFPYEGNEEFSGAGSRTQYASSKNAFKVSKDTLVHVSPDEYFEINSGAFVYFTSPWRLYKGSAIGLTGRLSKGTYAYISLKSPESTPAGLINIRAIEKPAGKSQSRVGMGASAQEEVYDVISQLGKENQVLVKKVSSAPPASNKPDLIIQYGSQDIQFEIKGRKSSGGYITVFDKSLRRGKRDPEIVEAVVEAYIESLRVDIRYDLQDKEPLKEAISVPLKEGMIEVGYPHSFEGIVDFYKHYVDPRYGYCADRGDTPKSGKLPSDFMTTDPNILSVVREKILEHLIESGDEYFVIYTSSTNTADIYSVGENNILQAIEFPKIVSAKLGTYGGCSSGATRVGFKIRIAPVGSNIS